LHYALPIWGSSVEGGTTVVLYNNVIAGLSAPNRNGTDQIRGIELASATASTFRDIHFNTVYVNAQSTGANFGTSALYHMASGTAGAGDLTLKNNILVNRSTPNGSGTTAAFRRSSSALANYVQNGSSPALNSGHNMFYAGTPGPARLIYTDGSNQLQTMATYQALSGLAPRDQASV